MPRADGVKYGVYAAGKRADALDPVLDTIVNRRRAECGHKLVVVPGRRAVTLVMIPAAELGT